ncbi:ClpXP protease specificity-enhancing factor [Chitiniphilus eburneus]|uniref:ClpXP protease specificity-enhancing factor n=1 Tax=Chitiniphilus eburneus TaxID=2571148 RepID=A0A4U0QCH5_9NEIS|nr:ClpXP protease specificity-enhancing factor [Chitiniphilus eburneus]TJZ79123.1 ClpXP protease specificity-enhancing factor [Chitiniphilus eburneus]
MQSVSTKPYLIRAIHEWCSDHGFTPYLVVAVRGKMQVPMEYVKNGEIVLNISYNATRSLTLGNDYVTFSARFNGVSREIVIPVGAVVSIFSRENGEGMGFEYEGVPDDMVDNAPVIPDDVPVSPSNGPDDEPPRPTGRPQLRVVK